MNRLLGWLRSFGGPRGLATVASAATVAAARSPQPEIRLGGFTRGREAREAWSREQNRAAWRDTVKDLGKAK